MAEEIVPKINVSDFLKPRAAKKDINQAELQLMFDDADSFPGASRRFYQCSRYDLLVHLQ